MKIFIVGVEPCPSVYYPFQTNKKFMILDIAILYTQQLEREWESIPVGPLYAGG